MKRQMILRTCGICNEIKCVRKDSAGIYCRSCRAKENSKFAKPIDMKGKRFGKLIALEISHQVKRLYFWKCLCDCGKNIITSGSRLRSGKTKSCGCIISKQNNLSRSPSYRSWRAMIQRCYDSSVFHYKRYGLMGISVCDSWKQSFSNFLKDMGERPEGKTLDRINPYGNYELNNCKWSTYKEQTKNKKVKYEKKVK